MVLHADTIFNPSWSLDLSCSTSQESTLPAGGMSWVESGEEYFLRFLDTRR